MRAQLWGNQGGFSTAELLTATAVALVAAASFVKLNSYQIHVVQDQTQQLALQTTARGAIDLFTREVRRAGQNPTCANGITPVVSASSSSLRIQADLDGDGALAATNEDITYRYNTSSGAFERMTNNVADPLVYGFTTTTLFRYYDASGTELVPSPTLTGAQLNNVRRVHFEITLSARAITQNGPGGTGHAAATPLSASAATDIDLRNRFFTGVVTCS